MRETNTTPARPGSSMKRPASIPTTSSERLAASIMASEARNAAGPPQNPITASSSDIGTTTQVSARSEPARGQARGREHRHLAVAIQAPVGQQHGEEPGQRQQDRQRVDRAQTELRQQQRRRHLAARDAVQRDREGAAEQDHEQHGAHRAEGAEQFAQQVAVDDAGHVRDGSTGRRAAAKPGAARLSAKLRGSSPPQPAFGPAGVQCSQSRGGAGSMGPRHPSGDRA